MAIFRYIFVLCVSTLCVATTIRAQWEQIGVSPTTNSKNLGVLHFRDGILWAAYQGITYSTDTGKTWSNLPMPQGPPSPGAIYAATDLSFFDQNNAILTVINSGKLDGNDDNTWGGIYQTHDRGNSWQRIFTGHPGCLLYRGIYNQSLAELHCLEYGPHEPTYIWNSLDSGKTWQRVSVGLCSGIALMAMKSGMLFTLSGFWDEDSLAHGYYSFDHGVTWQELPTEIGIDTYSVDVDSCDVNRVYAANEDWYARYRGYSTLYQSYDWGSTWATHLVIDTPGLAGTLASAMHSVYAGTMRNGIYRSLDQGITWVPIGGPNNEADSRNLCAINDNIIVAADSKGAIWATFNSGGDSVWFPASGSAISPRTLFATDTSQCGIAITRPVYIISSRCSSASVTSNRISGPDAGSYSVSFAWGGSPSLHFTPSHSGLHQGVLTFSFSDGSVDSISLRGYGASGSILSLATSDQSSDTLGGDVTVPISLNGLTKAEDIDLVLHYDTSLQYLGSYDLSGAKVDLAGEQWPGRSKLQITNVSANVVAAEARFAVFADPTSKSNVTFDSVLVLTSSSPCEYTTPQAIIAAIIPPNECGTITLSRFMQGKPWNLSIRPNPTDGNISIESSMDLDDATIEVFDALGIQRSSQAASLGAHSPMRLSLPSSEGMYYVHIKSQYGVFSTRVILMR